MNDVIVFPICMQHFLELYGLCCARSCPINEPRLSVSIYGYIAFDSGHSAEPHDDGKNLHEYTKSKHNHHHNNNNARIKKKHTQIFRSWLWTWHVYCWAIAVSPHVSVQPQFFFRLLVFLISFCFICEPCLAFSITIGMVTPARLNLYKTCARAHSRILHNFVCSSNDILHSCRIPMRMPIFTQAHSHSQINGHYHVAVYLFALRPFICGGCM